jgi:hypothetical protein
VSCSSGISRPGPVATRPARESSWLASGGAVHCAIDVISCTVLSTSLDISAVLGVYPSTVPPFDSLRASTQSRGWSICHYLLSVVTVRIAFWVIWFVIGTPWYVLFPA